MTVDEGQEGEVRVTQGALPVQGAAGAGDEGVGLGLGLGPEVGLGLGEVAGSTTLTGCQVGVLGVHVK